jgi:hypothetical protein
MCASVFICAWGVSFVEQVMNLVVKLGIRLARADVLACQTRSSSTAEVLASLYQTDCGFEFGSLLANLVDVATVNASSVHSV